MRLMMKNSLCGVLCAAILCWMPAIGHGKSPDRGKLLILGTDEKVNWDDKGVMNTFAPGKDEVIVYEIGAKSKGLKEIVRLPLANSVFGPPANIAITADETLALVANSVRWVQKDGKWMSVPDNKIYVIDLEQNPPKLIDTVALPEKTQPSGLDIAKAGNLALVANRAGNSVSVLKIEGKKVTVLDTIDVKSPASAVAITPDGTRAYVALNSVNQIAELAIDGTKVSLTGHTMAAFGPYNLVISPLGTIALSGDMGTSGAANGHSDVVSVIDLASEPVRVVDRVEVGDGPEGLAFSPDGRYAVAVSIAGSNNAKAHWSYNKNGRVTLLKIEGTTVTRGNTVEVGRLPEGAAFSADGRTVYVPNFLDRNISVLHIKNGKLVEGSAISIPGQGGSISTNRY